MCARNYYVRTIVGTLVRFEVGLSRPDKIIHDLIKHDFVMYDFSV